jgi:phosphonate transport system substrate-binding protein
LAANFDLGSSGPTSFFWLGLFILRLLNRSVAANAGLKMRQRFLPGPNPSEKICKSCSEASPLREGPKNLGGNAATILDSADGAVLQPPTAATQNHTSGSLPARRMHGGIMKRRAQSIFFSSALIAVLLAVDSRLKEGQAATEPKGETLSLGLVSTKPQKRIEEHRDFVDYLARKLSSTQDARGSVIVAPAPLELAKLLIERKVDFYLDSPYPTFVINKHTDARVLLRRWKGGVSDYRSVLFTKRDSGVTRLESLSGKIIAFEDPGSTTGYFLPKALLYRRGFSLTQKPRFEAEVSPTEIGYLFAGGSEKTILNWVLSKKVAAAALSDNDLDTLEERTKAEFLVLAETERFPRHFLSVRKDLDRSLVNRLKEILFSMHRDPEGQKILQKTDNTTKFDVLPGGEETLRRKMKEVFSPRPTT